MFADPLLDPIPRYAVLGSEEVRVVDLRAGQGRLSLLDRRVYKLPSGLDHV